MAPGTRAKILVLPAAVLLPLTRGRQVVGSARSAEARLLMACAGLVSETVRDLTPAGHPTVSEVAARWQFADNSHFIRAFKSQYGQTPGVFARLSRPDRDLT